MQRAPFDVAVNEFNHMQGRKAATLVEVFEKEVVVEFAGMYEQELEELFSTLKNAFETHAKLPFEIGRIEKTGSTYSVAFFSKERSPAEDIIEILGRYDEGTKPRTEDSED